MKQYKENWKWLIRVHQIMLAVLLVLYPFLGHGWKKASLVIAAAVVFSWIIQVLVYRAKPELYGDKVKQHPHEVLKKLI